MKNDLPFFSHDNDARSHPKMRALLAQFGPSGYGQFWILNEMISQAEDARLDLSKRVNKGAAAGEMRMTLDQLDAFLAFLSDPEIDLVNYKDGILTTDRTQDDYAAVKEKREADRTNYRRLKKTDSGNRDSDTGKLNSDTGIDTEQSRAEQSRIEQSSKSGALVDNFAESEEVAFADWVTHLDRVRKARNPGAMAKKLLTEPDVRAEFETMRHPPSDQVSARTAYPAPNRKCECGSALRSAGGPVAQCSSCGAWFSYDEAFGVWIPDVKKDFANSG